MAHLIHLASEEANFLSEEILQINIKTVLKKSLSLLQRKMLKFTLKYAQSILSSNFRNNRHT